MNTLAIDSHIEENTQISVDTAKMREALEQLEESERIVMELGFGLNGTPHSLDSIAKKLGRTKHWAMSRYGRGIGRLRDIMQVEIKSTIEELSPAGAAANFQEEVELKTAFLEKWQGQEMNRFEQGQILLKLRGMLAIPGRKGQFSKWLEENNIPRRTAYDLIDLVSDPEPLSDAEEKLYEAAQFDENGSEKRFAKLFRVVCKWYDPFKGSRNAAQILSDWDELHIKVRSELSKLIAG